MSLLPLITHPNAHSIIAWRDGRAITAAEFLVDVRYVSALLPGGIHILNGCLDRYRFMVGMAAALLAGKISLLPPTQTPEMIRQMRQFAPDTFCLTDAANCTLALPQMRFPALPSENGQQAAGGEFSVPAVNAGQTLAYVFTSGSTGQPVPHVKTWGAVVQSVRAEARTWEADNGDSHAVMGTVPPQHMYGFESTVLIVMQSANAMVTGQSFYPADIRNTLGKAPAPRILVSTPVHLKYLLEGVNDLPSVKLVVSATAPLSLELAAQVEAELSAPLIEIYGSTETGQIASRRLAASKEWTLFPGVRFDQEGDTTLASGGHIEKPIAMSDVIEMVGEDRFLLHGRKADLVNIAGKRNSLAYLNLQLTAIDGVLDGVFYLPDEASTADVARLAAFVVAPGLSHASLMAALRERIDPVFLPRPLLFVEALPRNSTGKLPRAALQALLDATAGRAP